MIRDFKMIIFIMLFISINACQAQHKTDNIKLKNSVWTNNLLDCDIYLFYTESKAKYISCESGDTIKCSYKFFSKDSLLVEYIESNWDKDFPVGSPHILKPDRTIFYLKDDKLIPIYVKTKNFNNEWIINTSIKFESGNYWNRLKKKQ